jgi:hypothetical protein
MQQFHLFHLESKSSAHDFIKSLSCLTDNVFQSEVTDIYDQFMVAAQVWQYITAVNRLGQAHRIDYLLPHCNPGSLIVYCTSCPEPGVNMEPGWEDTPLEFRHLNQIQLTGDGNHHPNHYAKNTDPHSRSLYKG